MATAPEESPHRRSWGPNCSLRRPPCPPSKARLVVLQQSVNLHSAPWCNCLARPQQEGTSAEQQRYRRQVLYTMIKRETQASQRTSNSNKYQALYPRVDGNQGLLTYETRGYNPHVQKTLCNHWLHILPHVPQLLENMHSHQWTSTRLTDQTAHLAMHTIEPKDISNKLMRVHPPTLLACVHLTHTPPPIKIGQRLTSLSVLEPCCCNPSVLRGFWALPVPNCYCGQHFRAP